MKTIGHLLNSEGPLFSILLDKNDNLLVKIHSNKYRGDLILITSFKKVVSYIESKLTLDQLIKTSTEYYFKARNNSNSKEPSLEEIKSSIVDVSKYYNEFSDSMK